MELKAGYLEQIKLNKRLSREERDIEKAEEKLKIEEAHMSLQIERHTKK